MPLHKGISCENSKWEIFWTIVMWLSLSGAVAILIFEFIVAGV